MRTMFPVLPNQVDAELDDLRTQVLLKASSLGAGMPSFFRAELSEFMLKINSYYTNAMEGNPSKLKDIQDALDQKFSEDHISRNYQREHVAHIEVQKKMIERLKQEPRLDVCSEEFLCWLHEEFYLRMPEKMRFSQTLSGEKLPIIPGALRERGATVGRHHAPETKNEIKNGLSQFCSTLSPFRLTSSEQVLAFASSHHRLLWIHPFPDGNGRVARLFTLAYAERIGIGADQLWNVTRAFARERKSYDRYLARADLLRRNDFDGRGPLSEEELVEFIKFFLKCCRDQLDYLGRILEFSVIHQRFQSYLNLRLQEKTVSAQSAKVLDYILTLGQVERGKVKDLCGVKERRANQIVKQVLESGIAQSPSSYGPLRLKLTVELAFWLFPDL